MLKEAIKQINIIIRLGTLRSFSIILESFYDKFLHLKGEEFRIIRIENICGVFTRLLLKLFEPFSKMILMCIRKN